MTSFNSPSIRNYHHLYCRYWTSYDQMVSLCKTHFLYTALKKDRQGMEEEYCVNLENLSVAGPLQRSTLPPALQPNSKRIEEMTELYGKAAQTIYGMETSLQLTFDKFCDLKQPKLWPNIPFKF
ncbi:uncharacterized protein F10E9.5-like isoform X2 [Limulus polyphemus]|uniref:Uncharacterized protein F10E9.5-like isoform X2 n=1 Tax=Limulus polyphemus TaxID=6850 RepID=A0ABM1SEG5_LIMPO|nr:uncharacterized protein F10E9.5-like isoform X2 [Limulus polyphemus]